MIIYCIGLHGPPRSLLSPPKEESDVLLLLVCPSVCLSDWTGYSKSCGLIFMKLGGWMRRAPGTHRLHFGTDQDLDPGPRSIFPLFQYGVGRFWTLNRITEKVVDECSWIFRTGRPNSDKEQSTIFWEWSASGSSRIIFFHFSMHWQIWRFQTLNRIN